MTRSINLRRAAVSAGATAAIAASLWAALPAAAAAAPPPANARAELGTPGGVTQLIVTGFGGANTLVVGFTSDNRFRITDTAPIEAGAGCSVAKATPGLFAVICTAPPNASGGLQSVRVNAGAGADSVTNNSPAPLRADGGPGNDVLVGGAGVDLLQDALGADVLRGNGGSDSLLTDGLVDTLPDVLDGGPGDDDLRADGGIDTLLGGDGQDVLRGGLGADNLDGGPGLGDTVSFLENGHDGARLVISVDDKADDGALTLGQPTSAGEKDNVRTSVEIVEANSGNDVIFGNDGPNTLKGGLGADTIAGGKGADLVDGGPGDDFLASNQHFGVPVNDGAIDTLNGSTGTDRCRIPFVTVEADITISCEIINQD